MLVTKSLLRRLRPTKHFRWQIFVISSTPLKEEKLLIMHEGVEYVLNACGIVIIVTYTIYLAQSATLQKTFSFTLTGKLSKVTLSVGPSLGHH